MGDTTNLFNSSLAMQKDIRDRNASKPSYKRHDEKRLYEYNETDHECDLQSKVIESGGQGEIRTRGLYHAKVTIFQLIYLPSKISDIFIIFKDF